MQVINEIERLKISFEGLDFGGEGEKPQLSNFQYFKKNAEQTHFIFVKEQVGDSSTWRHIHGNMRGHFSCPDFYGYRRGPVYQAEHGQRLVKGQRLNAEDYIESIGQLPTTRLVDLPEKRIVMDLVILAKDEGRFRDGAFHGYICDESSCKIVRDGDLLRIEVELNCLNNVLLVENTPYYDGEPKSVYLRRSLQFTQPQIPAVAQPTAGINLSLF